MLAVRCAPPGVRVVEVDEPEGNGELIRVSAVSICASDFLYIQYGSRQIIGHEIAGVLEDGTAVAVEAIFGCGNCEWCDRGAYNLCHLCSVEALGMTVDGGMSEYFRAPRRALVPLPPRLHPSDASLVEPGSVAWHACHIGGVGPDTRVAVVGGGAIGILAVLAARAQGAAEVALVARHPHQKQLGERFGAIEPKGSYDVVIEAAGSESSLHKSVEMARPRGTVAFVGVFHPGVAWPYRQAFMKEVVIAPALGYCRHNGRREFAEVADMLAARPEIGQALITHRFSIDEAVHAFDVARDRQKGTFRVVVHP
jgi:2-desacetyl-2-hydroxyethyl bacteriochlorophyllide A dehydrogenase